MDKTKYIILGLILLLVTTSSLGFNYPGQKWAGDSTDYVFERYFPTEWTDEVEQAANEWNSVDADFQFNTGGLSTGNYVYREPMGENGPIAEARLSWDSNEELTSADMVFNSDYKFSTTGAEDKYDVQSVATHEFGHWLRLKHSEDTRATMYDYLGKGQTRFRTLASDDKEGIKYIYGETP